MEVRGFSRSQNVADAVRQHRLGVIRVRRVDASNGERRDGAQRREDRDRDEELDERHASDATTFAAHAVGLTL
jgi:hypothetical protein